MGFSPIWYLSDHPSTQEKLLAFLFCDFLSINYLKPIAMMEENTNETTEIRDERTSPPRSHRRRRKLILRKIGLQ